MNINKEAVSLSDQLTKLTKPEADNDDKMHGKVGVLDLPLIHYDSKTLP